MNRPAPTTATASSIDAIVRGTLYRIGSPGDGEAEHRDEVHGPDTDSADGDRGQDQPARLGGAVVGPCQDHAAQPEERPQARHREGEPGIEHAVREVVDRNHVV